MSTSRWPEASNGTMAMTNSSSITQPVPETATSPEAFFASELTAAYRIARGLVDSDAAAEDVVQDAFVHAFRKWRSFRGSASRRSWFVRIVINTARSHMRRQAARQRLSRWLPHASAKPPTEAFATEARGSITAALKRLSPPQREAVLLVHLEGFTVAEAAALTGRAPGTIKTHLHRANGRLREELTKLWDATQGQ